MKRHMTLVPYDKEQLPDNIILERKLHEVTLMGDILGQRTEMRQRT